MNVLKKIKETKKIEPNSIVFVKFGSFYNIYDEDSFILSYLFGYKIKLSESNYRTCSFQITSSNKVFSELEENMINYLVIDKKSNFEITKRVDFKEENQYKNFSKIALPYISLKEKLEVLCQNILKNIDDRNLDAKLENLENIEKILYENNLIRS